MCLHCSLLNPISTHKRVNKKRMRVSSSTTRGVSVALLVMMMVMIQLKTSSSSVAALYNNNNSNSNTAGRRIADDLESEFLMDSEVRRMLLVNIEESLQKAKAAAGCGRGKPYKGCVPTQPNVNPKPDNCKGLYHRGCRG